jgi:hypothetical protein
MTDNVAYMHYGTDDNNGTGANNAMDTHTPDPDHNQEDEDDGAIDCHAVSSFVDLARTIGMRM